MQSRNRCSRSQCWQFNNGDDREKQEVTVYQERPWQSELVVGPPDSLLCSLRKPRETWGSGSLAAELLIEGGEVRGSHVVPSFCRREPRDMSQGDQIIRCEKGGPALSCPDVMLPVG